MGVFGAFDVSKFEQRSSSASCAGEKGKTSSSLKASGHICNSSELV